MKEIPKIEFKNTLNTLCKENTLVKRIIELLKAQFDEPKLNALKDDFQLLIDVCNYIENSVSQKNKAKVNKKDVVLAVYTSLFNLDETEIHKIATWIDTAHANGLIRRRHFFLQIFVLLVNFFSGRHI